jgi:hypothetical protein
MWVDGVPCVRRYLRAVLRLLIWRLAPWVRSAIVVFGIVIAEAGGRVLPHVALVEDPDKGLIAFFGAPRRRALLFPLGRFDVPGVLFRQRTGKSVE